MQNSKYLDMFIITNIVYKEVLQKTATTNK